MRLGCSEYVGIVHKEELKVGQILKVTKGISLMDDSCWLQTGDYVRVVSIAPHVILVEKANPAPSGYRMRECFPRESWELNLKVV